MNIDNLRIHRDVRGDLVSIDFSTIPFTPKRIFYITDVPAQIKRGEHGHYKCCQYYICIKGMIKVNISNGKEEKYVHLLSGNGIFIDKMIWTSEKFLTGNDVLMVLCSEEYDEKDYFKDKQILKS